MAATDLHTVQHDMIQYGTTFYFALGLIGNICNCIIFTRRSYCGIPSSIYFLSLSICSIIYLLWSISPFLYSLNHPDPQTESAIYCKLRLYGVHVLGQYIRYSVVFACADRFFATHRSVRLRSLSSVPIALKLTCLMVIVWPVVSVHMPFETNLHESICQMKNIYKLFFAVYQTTLVGVLPPVLMVIFSVFTIRSLHQRHDTQSRFKSRDRYLMRMVIAEVLVNVITSIPFSANIVYGAVTYAIDKSVQRQEIEAFVLFVTHFVVYLISVAPFYLFILTSKPFRTKFVKIIFLRCLNK